MKIYLAVLLFLAMPRLDAENLVYSYSELTKWANLEKPLFADCPGAQRVYELYDPKRDVAIKVYIDPKTPRAFVVLWAREQTVACKKNGRLVLPENVFSPLEVDMYGIIADYGLDGQKRIIDDKERIEKTTVGHWFQRPEKGDLTLILGCKAEDFYIRWRAGEEMPEVQLNRMDQREKLPNQSEQATPRKPSD